MHIKDHKEIFEEITYGCKHCSFRNESITTMKNHKCSAKKKREPPNALYSCGLCSFKAKQKGIYFLNISFPEFIC